MYYGGIAYLASGGLIITININDKSLINHINLFIINSLK